MILFVEAGSAQFEKFVRILGDEITLKGWEHFRGGTCLLKRTLKLTS